MTARSNYAFPIATAGTDGMGTNWATTQANNQLGKAFIPEIWSSKMNVKFYASTVFGDISNTDYEGEIKNAGDLVHIREIPTITIKDYAIGGDNDDATLTDIENLIYERPAVTKQELLIDKGKYWAFSCNDVEKKQSDLNFVNIFSQDAAEQLKITVDTGILADIWPDSAAANQGATAGAISASINLGTSTLAGAGAGVQLTKANIIDKIVELGQVLDEQNVPESDRWLVLPAWACSRVKSSDLKDASLTGDSVTPLRNGKLGMIDRFMIYKSNLMATGADAGANTTTAIIFGHKTALTFASQITQNEVVDNPYDFGQLMRGLMVYGYKVIKAESMGTLTAYPG